MGKVCALALLLALLRGAAPAVADNMRCNGEVVSEGDLRFEVLSKCGEPAAKESRQVVREVTVHRRDRKTSERIRTTVTVEEWTYNFGPGGFLYLVTFEDGTVVDIRSAGFGR